MKEDSVLMVILEALTPTHLLRRTVKNNFGDTYFFENGLKEARLQMEIPFSRATQPPKNVFSEKQNHKNVRMVCTTSVLHFCKKTFLGTKTVRCFGWGLRPLPTYPMRTLSSFI